MTAAPLYSIIEETSQRGRSELYRGLIVLDTRHLVP